MDALEGWFHDEKVKELFNIIVIYISEAHAVDEWNLSRKFSINQHKTVEERAAVARKYIKENERYKSVTFNMYVDSVENDKSFEKTYKTWPERGFVVNKNKIEYIAWGEPNNIIYWIRDIGDFIQSKIN